MIKLVKGKCSIRRGVFETNSSSSHSLCISGKSDSITKHLPTNSDNIVMISPDEFGWSGPTLCSPADKLSYIITMVFEQYSDEEDFRIYTGKSKWSFKINSNKIMETTEFKEIEKCIIENTDYAGLQLEYDAYDTDYAYIDHQSFSDDYESYKDFLDYYGITLADFLFNGKYQMIITNDNC